MRKLAITLAVLTTLALAAVALAAVPQKGPFAGKTALHPINGFADLVTFTASGTSLKKFTFGTLGCFGHGSYPVGTDPYADPTNTAVLKTVTVGANGTFTFKGASDAGRPTGHRHDRDRHRDVLEPDLGQRHHHGHADAERRHVRAGEDEVHRHARDADESRPQRRLTRSARPIHWRHRGAARFRTGSDPGGSSPKDPSQVPRLFLRLRNPSPAPDSRPLTGPSLRVAMLAPISWRVPPRHYGPWEQFVSLLTEGLVARGVDVTLFATADSQTRARLVGSAPTGYSEDAGLDAKVWESLHISSVFERAGEFDLIHNSFDFLPLTYSRLVDTPVVTTIHGFSSERIVPVFQKYNDTGYYVAISDADRHEKLDYIATIHHGIDMTGFELGTGADGYLLYFGRIHPDKGTVEAIDVAEQAGIPLILAGIVQDQEYFDRLVAPRIDGSNVTYVGPVWADGRSELLGEALRAPAPDQLRRAVRLQRDRGDGLRDPGDRDGTRIDAGDRRARDERLSRHDARRSAGSRDGLEGSRSKRRAELGRAALRDRPDGGVRVPRTSTGGSSRRSEDDRLVGLEGSVPGPAVSRRARS